MAEKIPFKTAYSEMSLLDFQSQFPDERSCWDYLVKMRWPGGPACDKCKGTKLYLVESRRVFECQKCGRQVSVTVGTIFQKSRIPLQKWFWAIFLMSTSNKGASMLYFQRQLGIKSYRAAWLMGHKIRQAMIEREELYTLSGTVQADEILIGGKGKSKSKNPKITNKTPFLMTVSETSNGVPRFVKLHELEDVAARYVIPAIKKGVEPGSLLKTDGGHTFWQAKKEGYRLKQSSYTQDPKATAEQMRWLNILTSNLKRFLISTYHGVFPKYRRAYLAEFAYRFNRRYWPHQAFDRLLYACINAKPITLPELRA